VGQLKASARGGRVVGYSPGQPSTPPTPVVLPTLSPDHHPPPIRHLSRPAMMMSLLSFGIYVRVFMFRRPQATKRRS